LSYNRTSENKQRAFIGLVKVINQTQTFSVLNEAEFRNFSAEQLLRATIIQNEESPHQMACIFTEKNHSDSDQSCIVFFEIRKGQIVFKKDIYVTGIYFPQWHGDYIYGLFEEDHGETHHLKRYDLRNDSFSTLKDDRLSFVGTDQDECVSISDVLSTLILSFQACDFCWYEKNLFIFIISRSSSYVYIMKFDTITFNFTRIDFPSIQNYAVINCYSRFFINSDGVICYCETIKNEDVQTDRYIRIPMR
jgi:hypothetical protein